MVQQKKIEIATQIAEQLRQAKATVFVDYRGMTVGEATKLRRRCRQSNIRYQVVKNRLAKRALSAAGILPPEAVLQGPTALALALAEPTAPARVLTEFRKECGHLAIKGGFLGKQWLDGKSVEALARIPSREILLSRLLGSLCAPLVRSVWALRAPVAKLAMALKGVAAKKPAEA